MTIPTTTIYYSAAYTAARESFDTTRKSALIGETLWTQPIPGIQIIAPQALTEETLLTVHTPAYVRAMKVGEPQRLAESNGFGWDPGMWDAVCASNGGAVEAAILAFQTRRHAGSLSSGLHHATAASGNGFCTFNGLALAARAVCDLGARSVLILDLDAHCGGGTYGLIKSNPAIVQLDIASSSFDSYSLDESGASTLDLIEDVDAYLPTLNKRLAAFGGHEFDLVLYNAGVDVHQACRIGGLSGVTFSVLAEREQVVFEWARARQVPVAFVLAGGYEGPGFSEADVARQHRLTIAAASLCNMGSPLETAHIKALASGEAWPAAQDLIFDTLGRRATAGSLSGQVR